MAKKEITKPPTWKVSGLAITRSGSKFTATWKVPSAATSDTDHRATGREVKWTYKTPSGKTHVIGTYFAGIGDTNSSVTLPSSVWAAGKLHEVHCNVRLYNEYGKKKHYADWLKTPKSYAIGKPSKVSIGGPTCDDNVVKCEFSVTDTSKTHAPRIACTQKVIRTGVVNGAALTPKTFSYTNLGTENPSNKTWEFTYTDASAGNMTGKDDYIDYEFIATASSPYSTETTSSKHFQFRRAKKPVLGTPKLTDDVIIVPLNTSADKSDTVKLQYGFSESSVVESWNDIGGEMSGNATSLSCARAEINPPLNNHVYFRVVATYLGNDSYRSYSNQVECRQLLWTAASGTAQYMEIFDDKFEHGDDSITVKMGWRTNSNYNATEISWSKDQDAWKSNKQPESLLMPDTEWNDGAVGTWNGSTSVKIRDLDEATRYWFRARRYNTTNPDLHDGWTDACTTMTGIMNSGAVLYAPEKAIIYEPFTLTWSVGGEKVQTHWSVIVSDMFGHKLSEFGGDGADTSLTIPGELNTDGLGYEITLVSVYDGESSATDTRKVYTVQRPTFTAQSIGGELITSKPSYVAIRGGSKAISHFSLDVVSSGATSNRVDGSREQFDGDVVNHIEYDFDPDSSYGVFLDITDGAELVDGAQCYVVVNCRAGGIDAEQMVLQPQTVAWEHKAKPATLSIEPVDGAPLAVDVTIAADAEAVATDSYNLWRTTFHGAHLIASGLKDGDTVRDVFSPFTSEKDAEESQWYTVETVTADGDRDWTDYPCILKCDDVVINWEDQELHLPYNLTLGDGWTKDVETVKYLDGSTEGHWNDGANLKQSIGAVVRKIGDDATRALIAELAQYPGSVFVRTPAGHAFEADVQVGSMTYDAKNSLVSCTLNATEVDNGLYGAVKPPEPDTVEVTDNA